jgi:hypothetical protein
MDAKYERFCTSRNTIASLKSYFNYEAYLNHKPGGLSKMLTGLEVLFFMKRGMFESCKKYLKIIVEIKKEPFY